MNLHLFRNLGKTEKILLKIYLSSIKKDIYQRMVNIESVYPSENFSKENLSKFVKELNFS